MSHVSTWIFRDRHPLGTTHCTVLRYWHVPGKRLNAKRAAWWEAYKQRAMHGHGRFYATHMTTVSGATCEYGSSGDTPAKAVSLLRKILARTRFCQLALRQGNE